MSTISSIRRASIDTMFKIPSHGSSRSSCRRIAAEAIAPAAAGEGNPLNYR